MVQRRRRTGLVERELTDAEGFTYRYSYNVLLGSGLSTIVGFLAGLLGTGGGVIHVPIMVQILLFPAHIATATSHYVLAISALTGTIVHLINGDLDGGYARTAAAGDRRTHRRADRRETVATTRRVDSDPAARGRAWRRSRVRLLISGSRASYCSERAICRMMRRWAGGPVGQQLVVDTVLVPQEVVEAWAAGVVLLDQRGLDAGEEVDRRARGAGRVGDTAGGNCDCRIEKSKGPAQTSGHGLTAGSPVTDRRFQPFAVGQVAGK